MEYNYSYNVLINRFNAFADGHYLIKRFTHGQIDLADLDNDEQYPFMHVTPDVIKPSNGAITFSFHIMFADIPRDKETKADYQREVISDCVRLAQDLIGEIKNGLTLFGYDVQMSNEPALEPFMEEYKNTLTGIAFTIDLEVPYNWSACDIPANWTIGGTSSTGGGGTAVGITFRVNGEDNAVQNILDLVAGSGITIVDNGNGSVTFTSTGDTGSASWGAITGTLSNQTDLQNALNAKANTADLGATAFSNDYGDLDNLPSIPPAQVNSDWNSISGVSEILNKPTIPTELRDLSDVNITSPVQNDTLIFDAGSNQFNNGQLGAVAYSNDYYDLTNLPIIPAAQVNSDWNSVSGVSQILNKPTIPAAQVNSDWNAVSGLAQILNKPTIPSTLDDLSNVNVPAPSNAQVLTYNTATSQWIASTPTSSSGTVTSVGLTMPAPSNPAFSVSNSPITNSGTLAVAANGTVDQYVDGTGALRTLPSTGGGGGQIFYFNGNTSQGTIGGNTYYQLGTSAGSGAAANFTRATTGVIARFITNVGSPNHLVLPSGVWTIDVYLSETGDGSNHAQIVAKLYTYNGTTFTLIGTSPVEQITNGNVVDLYTFGISVPNTVTAATDRIHIEFDIQNTNGKTVTLYTESTRIGEVHTTYAIGISSLNGLTESTQNFAVGTSGTDFAINSASATHTFNLPTASAANRGALSSADWSTFNGKQNNIGLTTVGTNLATLPNPSAVRFLRINADNTVTARTAAEMVSDLGISTGSISVLGQSQNASTIPASSTYFGSLFNGALTIVSADTVRRTPMVTGGTLSRLYVQTSAAQPATGSMVCTVRKNSVDQTLTLTIAAGSAAGVFTDLVNSVSVAAGDLLGMKFQNNATTVSANVLSNQVILSI